MKANEDLRRRLAHLEQELARLREELNPGAVADLPDALEVLVAVVSEQPVALPLEAVVEVIPRIPFAALPEAPPHLLGHMRWRGAHVPVIDLHFLWTGRPLSPARLEDRLIVVRHESAVLGLLVSEVTGVDHFTKAEWNRVRPETGGARFALALAHRPDGEVLLVSLPQLLAAAPLPPVAEDGAGAISPGAES